MRKAFARVAVLTIAGLTIAPLPAAAAVTCTTADVAVLATQMIELHTPECPENCGALLIVTESRCRVPLDGEFAVVSYGMSGDQMQKGCARLADPRVIAPGRSVIQLDMPFAIEPEAAAYRAYVTDIRPAKAASP